MKTKVPKSTYYSSSTPTDRGSDTDEGAETQFGSVARVSSISEAELRSWLPTGHGARRQQIVRVPAREGCEARRAARRQRRELAGQLRRLTEKKKAQTIIVGRQRRKDGSFTTKKRIERLWDAHELVQKYERAEVEASELAEHQMERARLTLDV